MILQSETMKEQKTMSSNKVKTLGYSSKIAYSSTEEVLIWSKQKIDEGNWDQKYTEIFDALKILERRSSDRGEVTKDLHKLNQTLCWWRRIYGSTGDLKEILQWREKERERFRRSLEFA